MQFGERDVGLGRNAFTKGIIMQRQLRFGTAAGSACGYLAGYASPDQSLVNIGDADIAATKLLKCMITVRDGGGKTNSDLVMLLLSGISLSVLIVGFALGYGTRASISHGPPTDNVRRRAF